MCHKMRPSCSTTNMVIKINTNCSKERLVRHSIVNWYVYPLLRVCQTSSARFRRKQDHGKCSEITLLPFPAQLARKSFHTPHYHNWVCFCSPLSITDIYCNKLNLVSAASLDLPEFVISDARLICCNLICAISSLAVELGGPGEIGPSGSL